MAGSFEIMGAILGPRSGKLASSGGRTTKLASTLSMGRSNMGSDESCGLQRAPCTVPIDFNLRTKPSSTTATTTKSAVSAAAAATMTVPQLIGSVRRVGLSTGPEQLPSEHLPMPEENKESSQQQPQVSGLPYICTYIHTYMHTPGYLVPFGKVPTCTSFYYV